MSHGPHAHGIRGYHAAMPIESLAWGYGLIEGPCVDGAANLYVSDDPAPLARM